MVVTRSGRRAAVVAALVLAGWAAGCDEGSNTITNGELELPEDLAAIEFTAEGVPTYAFTMLELRHPDGFSGFVGVDGAGDPAWWFRTEGSPFGFSRRLNGNFVLLDSDRGLLEITPARQVVREVAQQARPGPRIHHDVTATPWETVLFLTEQQALVGDTTVVGEALWEWIPEVGSVERRWSAFDDLDWNTDRGPRSTPDDWLHANSIDVMSDGGVLMSLHYLDQVIRITPTFDGIDWRLGGVGATIDVGEPFSGQHTAEQVGPNRILMFDNGYDREDERYSRAVEYEIMGDSAHVVWQWRPERDNWARVISSARRLPNGNTLVGFGTPEDPDLGSTGPIEVYEVTTEGEVVWHLTMSGAISSMYRATPVPRF